MNDLVRVFLWGTHIGTLGYATDTAGYATFAYEPDLMRSGIQVSPVHVRYPPTVFTFDQLSERAFHGLPGFIADSLPDSYGNQLIDIYMAEKGIPASEVTALDRLNYVSDRAMGALEYRPGESLALQRTSLDLQHLAELGDMVRTRKDELLQRLGSTDDRAQALSMIRIGSSAGGARSKALVARSGTGRFFDGTIDHGPHYSYWVLKFESASNRDRDGRDPAGMPVLEYLYSLIARESGIDIPRTDLVSDGRQRHFLIERFDRIRKEGKMDKLHYVSWAGLAHADRDQINSYEQLVLLVRKLRLGYAAEEQIFRRAVFNIIGRNQDDHTKNTGFLMDRRGMWRLSPAFDMTYSYDPNGRFTSKHQCWLSGKDDDFELDDLLHFGRFCNLSDAESRRIITRIGDAFSLLPALAEKWSLPNDLLRTVSAHLRMHLIP